MGVACSLTGNWANLPLHRGGFLHEVWQMLALAWKSSWGSEGDWATCCSRAILRYWSTSRAFLFSAAKRDESRSIAEDKTLGFTVKEAPEEKMGMANGSNFGIKLEGCTRCLSQASSDHCTAIRVEKSVGVALWGKWKRWASIPFPRVCISSGQCGCSFRR